MSSPPGAFLVVLALGFPAALSLAWPLRQARLGAVRLAPWASLPALLLALWPAEVPEIFLPALFTGLRFGLDPVGRVFLLFTAALWLGAGHFAHKYLESDPRRPAFFGFWLLAMAGNLGLILAQDGLGFYLCFALMTFAAYGLIVHARGREEYRAGRVYLVMAVLAEGALLSGVLLMGFHADALGFPEATTAYAQAPSPTLLAGLFLVGFAVKAGLVPLHLWLPLAHPVAPAPASALLSGAMIKAGLLGWLRFLPIGEAGLPTWGALLVAGGVFSVFYGVAVGACQTRPKTVLAYSSISQIGFMAVGVGIALISPAHAPVALLATAHYAAHHALAKGALFLLAGLAPAGGWTGRLRGLAYLGAVLPALSLAGAPFTSGAAAKKALELAVEALDGAWPRVIAFLLALGAVGTTLLLARFLAVLPRERSPGAEPPSFRLWLPWAALVATGFSAPLWLPWAYAAPEGAPVFAPAYGNLDSLWPVALGALLGFALWRFSHRAPRLVRISLPAGDVLELLTAAGSRLRRAWPGDPGPRIRQNLAPLATRARVRWRHLALRAQALDQSLRRGYGLGLALFIVLLALAVALRAS